MVKKVLALLLLFVCSGNYLRAQILISSGGANAYTIPSYPGNFTSYYDGFSVIFKAHQANTGPATMNIAGQGVVNIVNTSGNPLAGNDILANQVIMMVYDASGGRFQMISTSGNVSGGASTGWSTTGNTGTVDGTHFIGTTDAAPFNIKVNNQKAGRIESAAGTANTFYGFAAGDANTGTFNTAMGYQALAANVGGNYNTATGYAALGANSTGSYNTAGGVGALYSNTAGSHATAFGYYAMRYANDQGGAFINSNVAVGYEALRGSGTASANTGNSNTAVGYQALVSNITGFSNTAHGFQVLYFNTHGGNNTAIGYGALNANTIGNHNTALGFQAGYTAVAANANTTGSYNVFLGYNAGPGTTTQLDNAIAIGKNALVNANNSMALGGTGADAVNVGIGTSSPGSLLHLYKNTPASITEVLTENNASDGTSQILLQTNNSGATIFNRLELLKGGPAASGTVDGIALANLSALSAGAEAGALMLRTVTNNPIYFLSNNLTRMTLSATGNLGIGITAPASVLHINSTDAVIMPVGNSANRPATPVAGMVRYNTDVAGLEYYNAAWNTVSPAPWSVSGSTVFYNSGNVGMGTSSPTTNLSVHRTGDANMALSTQGAAAGDDIAFTLQTMNNAAGSLLLGTGGTTKGWVLGARGNAWGTVAEQNMAFMGYFDGTSWIQPLSLLPNGNIGINTTTVSANAKLAIKDGHIQSQQAAAPSISAGPALGGGTTFLFNATDVAGKLRFTPSGTAIAGIMAVITFNKPYATAPIISLTPANNTAAQAAPQKQVYVTNVTTGGFQIAYFADPGPTPAPDFTSLPHDYYYQVIETQ